MRPLTLDVIQKSVRHERLLASPDLEKLQKGWTDCQEELARHKAWNLLKELFKTREAYTDVHSMKFFKRLPPTK